MLKSEKDTSEKDEDKISAETQRAITDILGKTRKINNLLQRDDKVEYGDISAVLSEVLSSNVYITDKQGKILGHAFVDDFECDLMVDVVINAGEFPRHYVNWLLKIDKTAANRRSKRGKCAYKESQDCRMRGKNTTIVPIFGGGERMGTLIIAKYDEDFLPGDLLLAEYGATVVGMELLKDRARRIELDARKKATVQVAMDTLSSSERHAVVNIIYALDGTDGLLVTSKIAENKNITRSVVVNALRKLESAGVIESKSLGMKGTYIRVLNEHLLDEVPKLKQELKAFEDALQKKRDDEE